MLDTPGHVDFSAEMERVLQVLDYAVLLISGADGVQGHTQTLWSLLQQYEIPTFLFVNKMDQPGARSRQPLMAELKEQAYPRDALIFPHASVYGRCCDHRLMIQMRTGGYDAGTSQKQTISLIPEYRPRWSISGNHGMRSWQPVRRRHWKPIWRPERYSEVTDSGI